ncbi:hypothetical protein I204_03078 [Kwoniella mangroviensis CBS 8886]|uniref:uncharacterized protein n=1 Tax=Kwoniella mangroviensis CBS 8507 TaxID=1296122 RepID=UPI00080D105C|nr:uncharacterized protein I203_00135 [Kwoniella mangroviensis CBS 8507]OCF70006.1 hypothetical protein I203_00135 [Kwoniella mangroviensis CBS 8507]OCF75784.1 hypothetical protein I204_03078 [Kwoniella mangroviensis CBS 8886]
MFCIPPHLQEEVQRPRYETSQPVNLDSTLRPLQSSASRPTYTARSYLPISRDSEMEKNAWDVEKQSYDVTTESNRMSFRRTRNIPISLRLIIILSFLICQLIFHPFSIPFSAHSKSVQSLDHTLVKHCQSLLTPPQGIYTDRLEYLSTILSNDTAWISEPSPSTEYYTSFSKDRWFLSERPFLISIVNSQIVILTPAFEALRASLIVKQLPVEVRDKVQWVEWREDQSPYAVLSTYLAKRGVGRFVLDDGVREFIGRGLREKIGEIVGSGLEDRVREVRERKGDWEIGLLKCANQFTLHAIRKTRERMYIGITESQMSKILEEEMAKTGLIGGEGLVLFGENAALPHGSGTDRQLTKKDLVLIDAGGKWGGYVSDITRTFALPSSTIPESHIELWETVRKAQRAPYEMLLKSNGSLTFGDLDRSARKVVTEWKRQDSDVDDDEAEVDFSIFTHRLGHGIGLEGHESPYVIQGPQGKRKIQEGNVFSLEPGIYLPANHEEVNGLNGVGVRLEDCFVLRKGEDGKWGGEWLSGPVEGWGDI